MISTRAGLQRRRIVLLAAIFIIVLETKSIRNNGDCMVRFEYNENGAGRPGQASSTHSCGSVTAVPSHLRTSTHMWPQGLHHFYQKYTEAYGIPVIGSRAVSDASLQRACYVARFMFADQYSVRHSYYRKYGRLALIGQHEVTTSIPEHSSLSSWWNSRTRGLGATCERPVCTAGEENALCLGNDTYSNEDIMLHEFSHGLRLQADLDRPVRELYDRAKLKGLWGFTYAITSHHEYFAEGVQSYFDANAHAHPPDGIHNHVSTRQALRQYDPGLFAFLKKTFSCGNTYIDRCRNDRDAELSQEMRLDCSDPADQSHAHLKPVT